MAWKRTGILLHSLLVTSSIHGKYILSRRPILKRVSEIAIPRLRISLLNVHPIGFSISRSNMTIGESQGKSFPIGIFGKFQLIHLIFDCCPPKNSGDLYQSVALKPHSALHLLKAHQIGGRLHTFFNTCKIVRLYYWRCLKSMM